MDYERAEQDDQTSLLKISVDNMYKKSGNTSYRELHASDLCLIQVDQHSSFHFSVCDIVSVWCPKEIVYKKRFLRIGWRIFVSMQSFLVYQVSHLEFSDVQVIHCVRLQHYGTSAKNGLVSKKLINVVKRTEVQCELISKTVYIADDRNGIFPQVQLLGHLDKRDRKWILISDLTTEVPDPTETFLSSDASEINLIQKATTSVGLSLQSCTQA